LQNSPKIRKLRRQHQQPQVLRNYNTTSSTSSAATATPVQTVLLGELLQQVEISTVDGFQGEEKDIILISMVRSSNSVGFLSDYRRLNVAASRARCARWSFGNVTALQACENEDIRNFVKEHHTRDRSVIHLDQATE